MTLRGTNYEQETAEVIVDSSQVLREETKQEEKLVEINEHV